MKLIVSLKSNSEHPIWCFQALKGFHASNSKAFNLRETIESPLSYISSIILLKEKKKLQNIKEEDVKSDLTGKSIMDEITQKYGARSEIHSLN